MAGGNETLSRARGSRHGARNAAEAVNMAEHACDLTGRNNPEKTRTLAAAYAENGQFQEAITTIRQAMELGAAAGRSPEFASRCRQMLESFQRSQPWREPVPQP